MGRSSVGNGQTVKTKLTVISELVDDILPPSFSSQSVPFKEEAKCHPPEEILAHRQKHGTP